MGAGERVGLRVISGNDARHIEVAARPVPAGFFAAGAGGAITAFVSALALAIAVAVGLCQPDRPSLRYFVLAVFMQPLNYAVASVVLSFAALALAWREAMGEVRTRISWIAASIGLVYLSYLWSNAMALLGLAEWARSVQAFPALAIAVGYCGLAYALLRHRVFDLGFAVNRAIVYAVVSGVLLVAFGLLEWASHKLIHFETRGT